MTARSRRQAGYPATPSRQRRPRSGRTVRSSARSTGRRPGRWTTRRACSSPARPPAPAPRPRRRRSRRPRPRSPAPAPGRRPRAAGPTSAGATPDSPTRSTSALTPSASAESTAALPSAPPVRRCGNISATFQPDLTSRSASPPRTNGHFRAAAARPARPSWCTAGVPESLRRWANPACARARRAIRRVTPGALGQHPGNGRTPPRKALLYFGRVGGDLDGHRRLLLSQRVANRTNGCRMTIRLSHRQCPSTRVHKH